MHTTEHYTPGHTSNATSFMAERDMESHGFYLNSWLQPDFNVLDVGCGPGTISADIAEAVFPGQVTAVDISPAQLEYGLRLSQGRELVNIRFLRATAYQLPCPDMSFDLVFAHALLEHLNNPVAALREFYRALMPGGFAVVCSPDWAAFEISPCPDAVEAAFDTYRQLQQRNGGHTDAGAQLPCWLRQAGFQVLEENAWLEQYHCPRMIGEHLALQLETFGFAEQGDTLREWAQTPGARFAKCWKYAIGTKPER